LRAFGGISIMSLKKKKTIQERKQRFEKRAEFVVGGDTPESALGLGGVIVFGGDTKLIKSRNRVRNQLENQI
jgi:hypothetical protein